MFIVVSFHVSSSVICYKTIGNMQQLPRFHVHFWLCYYLINVHLFFLCLRFCPSKDRNI